MIVESAHEIWYSKSADGLTNWSAEKLVSEGNPTYYNALPSITIQDDPHRLVVVWEAYTLENTEHVVAARTIDASSGSMSGLLDIGYSETSLFMNPVVASGIGDLDHENVRDALIVWYDGNEHTINGRVLREAGSLSSVVALRSDVSSPYGISIAPISRSSTLTEEEQEEIAYTPWQLVWAEDVNTMYYSTIIVDDDLVPIEEPELVALNEDEGGLKLPSAVNFGAASSNPAAVWEEIIGDFDWHVIKFRERNAAGWQTPVVFSGVTYSDYTTPSITAEYGQSDIGIVWRTGSSQLKYVNRHLGSWSSQATLATGVDPNISVGIEPGSNEVVLSRGTSSLYAIQQTSLGYTQEESETIMNGPSTNMFEGRGAQLSFPEGLVHLVVLNAELDNERFTFPPIPDSLHKPKVADLPALMRSRHFRGDGLLTLHLLYTTAGNLPADTGIALTLIDAHSGNLLEVLQEFDGLEDTVLTLQVPLSYHGRQVDLGIQASNLTSARRLEVERWVVDEASTSKSNETLLAKVPQQKESLPTVFALHENYPNPFNPTTTLQFDLPEPADVSLVIYDVLGKEVATLASGYREAGYHTATWSPRNVASGVYFARFTATAAAGQVKYSKLNKLVLMK